MVLLCSSMGVAAEFRVAHPFQDHMVLQRQKTVPVWGWGDAGKKVTVKIGSSEGSAQVNDQGAWRVNLPPMEANTQGQTLSISSEGKTIELQDVLIGEVWFAAGQSNMARTVASELREFPMLKDEVADSNYPLVRFISYGAAPSDTPLTEPKNGEKWTALTPSTVGSCMHSAFYFGRDLHKELNIPVGLVLVAVSGTPQRAWAAKEVLEALDGAKGQNEEEGEGEEEGSSSEEGGKESKKPSVLYNSQIHPHAPMALRGFIWDQGAAGPMFNYGIRMVAIVEQWRKLYEQDFYFIFRSVSRKTDTNPPLQPFVQNYYRTITSFTMLEGGKIFSEKGSGALVGVSDLGNFQSHWGRKDEGGRRMVLAALNGVYGIPKVYTGPQLIESSINGSTVRCKFSNVGTGLKYVPSIDGISGFVMQGTVDGKDTLVWATPKVEGTDTLTFSHPDITAPKNLFYGWNHNPHETLFNNEGYPAYCFSVGGVKTPKTDPGVKLVQKVDQSKNKTPLHISHVRRYAYVFSLVSTKGPGSAVPLKAYLPKEWEKPALMQDGKALPLGEISTGDDGNRFITVEVEPNAPYHVLYDASKPEALASADTGRF
jgi:sialate O-acetylesterase